MSEVALIHPPLVSSESSYSTPLVPPIGLAYLSAALRKAGIGVTPIDATGLKPDQFIRKDGYTCQGLSIDETVARIPERTDLIGITCMFTQDWPLTRRLVRAIRARFPKTPLVAGGEHVTALPAFSLEDAPGLDFLALGEGEETVVDLARILESSGSPERVSGLAWREGGKLRHSPHRQRIKDVDGIPQPAWDLFPMEVYLSSKNAHGVYLGRSMPILATRGCPFQCTFCSNPVMYGTRWLARGVDKVLDEIEHYLRVFRVQNIDFYDLTMILKKDWILALCQGITRRGLHFTWQLPSGTRSEVIDEQVTEALARTGCRNITFAPESGSLDTLRKVKKRVQLPKIVASIRAALCAGMNVKCNLIIGFPHESFRHIAATILFAWRLAWIGAHDVPFYLFSPYPGSELFEEIRARRYAGGLDAGYFRSLLAFMDLRVSSDYCLHVSPTQLAFWRLFGMATFYLLSFLIRPWRLISLLRNLASGKSRTVLEQRLSAMIMRRPS